jgi:hypothetical protein
MRIAADKPTKHTKRNHNSRIAVAKYREKGWNVFPLPLAEKEPPPKGVTGKTARPITEDDYRAWRHQWRNMAIVLPDGVVGLDVDVYKNGGRQLPDDLPFTVRTTSRTDGSGIYLYRVPPGMKFVGDLPDGLGETIQPHHRYAIVAPSLHPSGRVYRWLDDDDNEVGIPDVDDLPDLPDAWVKRLQQPARKHGSKSSGQRTGKGFEGDVDAWLDNLPPGPMSTKVRATLRRTVRSLRRHSHVCRYDVMVGGTKALVQLGALRQRGVGQALDDLIDEYIAALEGEPDRNPWAELDRAISGAVAKFGVAQ